MKKRGYQSVKVILGERWAKVRFRLRNDKIFIKSVIIDYDNIVEDLTAAQMHSIKDGIDNTKKLYNEIT
jgi:hypothetical protein